MKKIVIITLSTLSSLSQTAAPETMEKHEQGSQQLVPMDVETAPISTTGQEPTGSKRSRTDEEQDTSSAKRQRIETAEETQAMAPETATLHTEDTITLISGDKEFIIPKELATKYLEFIKLQVELDPSVDRIKLSLITPDDLKIIVDLIKEADQILVNEPATTAQGSYVQLSESSLLEKLLKPTAWTQRLIKWWLGPDTLIRLLHNGSIYAIDKRIQQAVALKLAQLVATNQVTAEQIKNMILTEAGSNMVSVILPYVAQQYYLLTDSIPEAWDDDFGDGISVRDLLVHDKIPPLDDLELNLNFTHLGDLDGLNDIPNITNLQRLYLYNNQLTDLQPGIFNALTNLQELSLAHNQLTALQPGIFDALTNLQKLYLYDNQLHVLQPGIFDALTNLRKLSLNNNQLHVLQPGIFNALTNLQKLYLENNQLQVLQPDIFNALTNLQVLSLGNNQLTDLQPGIFNALTNLQELSLENNQLIGLQPGIFDALTNLQALYLYNNQLKALQPGIFNALTSLQGLNLRNNQLKALQPGIFNALTNLQWLNLHNNQLKALRPSIFGPLTNLQELNLYNNQLKALQPGIFNALTNLQRLNLKRNSLDERTKQWIQKRYPFAKIW